jgi:hypothetical protein
MGGDGVWGDDGAGTTAAAEVGLAKPTPKLAQVSSNDISLFIFESASQLCLWNVVEDEFAKIVKPATLAEIKTLIREGNLREMKVEVCG